MSVCHMHTWCLQRLEDPRELDGCEPMWVLGIEQRSSQEQHELVIPEPSVH